MNYRWHGWVILLALAFISTTAATFYLLNPPGQDSLNAPAGYLAADKTYGVTIDLTQYSDPALVDTLTTLRQNNLFWLRQPILWAELEPEPDRFDWQPLDRILSAVARANDQADAPEQRFRLIVVLYTSPRWARPAHTPRATPPAQLSDFGNFARVLAARYGGQLDYYQIWHEPNLSLNWGNRYIEPAGYAQLLREAALNIREADPVAFILSAALAPTLEDNDLNLNEMAFLDQLYRLKADQWFDIVAGQPYGFDFAPSEPARADRLNFRRLELLRRVMLRYGDTQTPIWATAFGWNLLPLDWTGRPPPWRSDQTRRDPPELQRRRSAAALEHARREWPWLGPMLAIRWDSADLAADDPARGFALLDNPALLTLFREAGAGQTIASPGDYPAGHPSGHYSPGWRFGRVEADIPRAPPYILTLPFDGTHLDLKVNRGSYRGYLWVSIDGQAANALPLDNQGRSYIVLYDPLRQSEPVTLAQDLPPGTHQAVIEAAGGWGQWAISGWTVYNHSRPAQASSLLPLTALGAVLSGLGLARQFRPALRNLTRTGLAVGRRWVGRYLALAEAQQVALTFGLAISFYLGQGLLAQLLVLPLAAAILVRPDIGLALVAFNISFFLLAKPLPTGLFWPLETTLLLTTLGIGLRQLIRPGTVFSWPSRFNYELIVFTLKSKIQNPNSTDWPALALAVLAYLATLTAQDFGISMHEWRMLVAGSVLYYFLVRLGLDYGPACSKTRLRWAWRLLDAFIAGAVLHAGLALYEYLFTNQTILAEGVRRAVGPIYGSPNNLSLFLGRAWPILLAVALIPAPAMTARKAGFTPRRWLYSGALLVVSLALFLTFSKGALLLAMPAAVLAMTLWHIWHHRRQPRRRMAAIAAGWLLLTVAAIIPLSRTARFRTTFDLSQGSTGFFRLKLWQAAWQMLQDHWLLGVGLNNFLYQYRTRYILPEAWQEPNLSHPHNLVLDFGTRLGLGGIGVLIWLQITFWRNAWRLYQALPQPMILGLIGSMVVFLSHGLIDNSYFLIDLAFTFFLTLALIQKLADDFARPISS